MTAALALPAPTPPPRLRLMNDISTDETLAPPTDRDAPTQTDNPKPHRDAVNPPPSLPSAATADSVFSDAVRQIVEAAHDIRAERESRRQFEQQQLEHQERIIEAINRAERSGDANWKATQHQNETWRKVSEAKEAQQDDRIASVERAIEALKAEVLAALPQAMTAILAPYIERIEALERELSHLKAHGTARATEATPAT
jgi:hypothetical protein